MLRRIGEPIGGIVLALALLIAPASADDEGYVDNWIGAVKIELQVPNPESPSNPAVHPIPDSLIQPPPVSFSDRLKEVWAGQREEICRRLRVKLEQESARWLSCELGAAGELRGRALNPALNPNRLDLKYLIAGNRIRFEMTTGDLPLDNSFDPVLEADFVVGIRLTLEFETTLNGGLLPDVLPEVIHPNEPYMRGPMSITSASISIYGARLTSNYDPLDVTGILIAPRLREAERKLVVSESLPLGIVPLSEVNIQLYRGAKALRGLLPDGQDFTPNYLLETFPRENEYVIRYVRPVGVPQPLPGCQCDSECGNDIGCTCSGVGLMENGETLLLQKQVRDGSWAYSGHNDSWSVRGRSLGAANGEDVTVRLCLINTWGRGCGSPITFRYRDWGACVLPDWGSDRSPLCSEDETHCRGACRPSEQCEFEQ
jgi:hypothetical protein